MDTPPVQYTKTNDGYSIAFTVEGGGLPLIEVPTPISHVLSSRGYEFHPDFIPAARERFLLVRYDSRGQGLSQRGLGPNLTRDDYVEDLDAVANNLELSRFALFAISGMANVAIRYAFAHPERVAALVVLDPVVPRQSANNKRGPMSTTSRRLPALQHLSENDWDFFVESSVRMLVPDREVGATKRHWLESTTQADFLAQWHAEGAPIEPMLPAIQAPTLAMAARNQSYAFADEEPAKGLVATIPSARLALLDYPAHGAIFPLIDDFITGLHLSEDMRRTENGMQLAPSRDGLSMRELEVLRLIAAGKTNSQIGVELMISRNTVLRHVNHIFAKTGAVNRVGATSYAHRQGLV